MTDLARLRLSWTVLCFTVPVFILSALLQIALWSGHANVHGGSGYLVIVLSVLAPLGTVVVLIVLPFLFVELFHRGHQKRSPLLVLATLVGTAYILYSVVVAWYLWPVFMGSK